MPEALARLRARQAIAWRAAQQVAVDDAAEGVRRSVHDLRSNLTGIVGYAGLIGTVDDLTQIRAWTEKILEAAATTETALTSLARTVAPPDLVRRENALLRPSLLAGRVAEQVGEALADVAHLAVETSAAADASELFGDDRWLVAAIEDLVLDQATRFASIRLAIDVDGPTRRRPVLRVEIVGDAPHPEPFESDGGAFAQWILQGADAEMTDAMTGGKPTLGFAVELPNGRPPSSGA